MFAVGGRVYDNSNDLQPAFPTWVLRTFENLCPIARGKSAMHLVLRSGTVK
jgi:hypothetical protein